MNVHTQALHLFFACASGLACADRPIESQCFPVDPRTVWHGDDIGLAYETYCDRGSTKLDRLRRTAEFHCIPKPESGCNPCLLDRDEADEILLDKYMTTLELAECPSDYEPERVLRGCFAELVETEQCCWTSEFYADPDVCDPGPPTTFP